MRRIPLRPMRETIARALEEDRARRDITSDSILPPAARIWADLIARQPGMLAGIDAAACAFRVHDPALRCRIIRRDGAALRAGHTLLTVTGRARSIFAAERTALNVLGHLSGIATLTHAYVRRIRGSRALILDTRKTLPGLRDLEKYAVSVGGGVSHRRDLAAAILVKTNHLRAAYRVQRRAYRQVIHQAVTTARRKARGRFVEIEAATWREFTATVEARPDAILLDNWRIPDIRRAVRFLNAIRATLNAKVLLEVSGGVTLANVRAIARTGVDRISIGRLTHSAPALDVSLRVR